MLEERLFVTPVTTVMECDLKREMVALSIFATSKSLNWNIDLNACLRKLVMQKRFSSAAAHGTLINRESSIVVRLMALYLPITSFTILLEISSLYFLLEE